MLYIWRHFLWETILVRQKKKAIIQHRLHFCRYHFSNQILRSCTIKKHRTKLNFSSIVLIRYPWTHNFLQPNHHKNNCNYNYHEQVLPWFLTILRSCTINMTLNDVILLPRANFTIIYHNTVKTIAITITIKMPSRNLKALANPSRKKKELSSSKYKFICCWNSLKSLNFPNYLPLHQSNSNQIWF
jgi:hypothetical protein